MGLIYILALILLIVVILAFTALLRVAFRLDTESENMRLRLLWLYPFLEVAVESSASLPVLSVYFFKTRIWRKELTQGKSGGGNKTAGLVRAASARDIHLDTSYGFRDPFITGLACGAVSAASAQTNRIFVNQDPDFTADRDYIFVDATARVNLGTTIMNYFKSRLGSK